MTATGDTFRYALGHSDRELNRLRAQARRVDPVTRAFFGQAGIAPGMRVLDVGSGAGDVAFLLAELVGDTGEVVGVDREPGALAVASARAASRGNVSFREGDPARMTFERSFDAVVGRYVLQFQPDPVAMLRALVRHLHPGGIVAFHELDWDSVRSFPASPTYDQCCRWVVETLAERMSREVISSDSVIVGRAEIGAWSRVQRYGSG